jgi:hypothetical protein
MTAKGLDWVVKSFDGDDGLDAQHRQQKKK